MSPRSRCSSAELRGQGLAFNIHRPLASSGLPGRRLARRAKRAGSLHVDPAALIAQWMAADVAGAGERSKLPAKPGNTTGLS